MPRFRIVLDVEADNYSDAIAPAILRNGYVQGYDQLENKGQHQYYPARTVTFYRRATTLIDTVGDFLPMIHPCDDGTCSERAVALIGFSDGAEVKVCVSHLQDWAGVLLQRELEEAE